MGQRHQVAAVLVSGLLWAACLFALADTPAAQHVSNAGLLSVALLAGLAAVARARRDTGVSRRFWRLLGAAVLSWAAGQTVWTWYESVLSREVPFPAPADIGYLALPPLAAAALFVFPVAAATVAGRIRTVLDGLIVATSLLLTSWLIVLGPAFRAGGDGLVPQAISLAYPVGDVVVLTMVVYTWSRSRQCRDTLPVSLPLVGTGLAAFAVSDSGFTYLTNAGMYTSGNLIDLGWFAGFACLLLAALKNDARRGPADAGVAVGLPTDDVLPYAAVGVALMTSVMEYVRDGYGGEFTFWVRTSLMVLLIARQILTLRENAALTRNLERRVQDRTAELTASRQRFSALAQHSSDLVTVVDRTGVVSYQSQSSARILGYQAAELLGRPLSVLMDAATASSFLGALEQAASDTSQVRTVRSSWHHATGRTRQVDVTITNLLHDPDVTGLVLNARDVTDRVMLEEQLTRQAFSDALTGLPNKAMFTERLEHALRRCVDESALTVLFLDLDGFKAVNDTLGHSAGDMLLVDVAERLRSVVRSTDTVARFGGDEFAILVDEMHDDTYGAELAERIVDRLSEAFQLHSEEVHITASIGIASSVEQKPTAEQVLRNADLAMYQAKAAGKGAFAVYHPNMHAGLVDRVRMEADLRRALDNDQLFLDYQPIVTMSTGQITGMEALVRWRHPGRGVVPPEEFIPVAEASGLIRDIGRWVLRQACQQAIAWHAAVPTATSFRMSVNLSGQQVLQADLVDQVAEILSETGLAAGQLALELTESVLIDNSEQVLTTLLALRDMGVSISLDDFGTGYSSLNYLHRFPIDTLKIDRSFVERLSSGSDATLIDAILAMAQSLRMHTVAEGIENAYQSRLLQARGCTTGQGFYFSPPVSAAQIEKLLRKQGWRESAARTVPSQPRPAGRARTGPEARRSPAPTLRVDQPTPLPDPVSSLARHGGAGHNVK